MSGSRIGSMAWSCRIRYSTVKSSNRRSVSSCRAKAACTALSIFAASPCTATKGERNKEILLRLILCPLQQMGVKDAHPERPHNRRSVQEKQSEPEVVDVREAMPGPAPGHEAKPSPNTHDGSHKQPEEHALVQIEQRCRQPSNRSWLAELQHKPGAEDLGTKKAEKGGEDKRVVVEQRNPAEDHSWPQGARRRDEGRQPDDCEPALHEELRRSRQDREEVAHPIAPGLQVRLPMTTVAPESNRHLDDLGTGAKRVDEQLRSELHPGRGSLPTDQPVAAESAEPTVTIC